MKTTHNIASEKTLRYDTDSTKEQYFEKSLPKKPSPMYTSHLSQFLTFQTIDQNKNPIFFSRFFKNYVKVIGAQL